YFDQADTLETQLKAKQKQVKDKAKEIQKERDYVAAMTRIGPLLAQWEKLSLPESKTTVEGAKGQLSLLQAEYHKYLSSLLDECKIKKRLLDQGKIETKIASVAGAVGPNAKKPLYHAIAYQIEGDGDLHAIVRFFEKLYAQPLLHQIKSFTVSRIASEKEPNLLSVKMTVEVLQVAGAEKKDEARPGLFPKLSEKEMVAALARKP